MRPTHPTSAHALIIPTLGCLPTHFADCLAPLLIITPSHRHHLGHSFSCPSICLCRPVQCVSLLACCPSLTADALRSAIRTNLFQSPGQSPIALGLQSVLGGLLA